MTIVPIIIGALGTVCTGFNTHLNSVSQNAIPYVVRKTALLGTAHILRNFLT